MEYVNIEWLPIELPLSLGTVEEEVNNWLIEDLKVTRSEDGKLWMSGTRIFRDCEYPMDFVFSDAHEVNKFGELIPYTFRVQGEDSTTYEFDGVFIEGRGKYKLGQSPAKIGFRGLIAGKMTCQYEVHSADYCVAWVSQMPRNKFPEWTPRPWVPSNRKLCAAPDPTQCGSRKDHAELYIGHDSIARLVVGNADTSNHKLTPPVKTPGFVEIWPTKNLNLSNEQLAELLAGLSFFFGRSLGLHGVSHHSSNGSVVSVDVYSELVRSGRTGCLPPADLYQEENLPVYDKHKLATAIRAFLTYPDRERLKHVIWRYEFGRAAIWELAGVYYGGALEILEQLCEPSLVPRIPPSEFDKLKSKLFRVLEHFAQTPDSNKPARNNVANDIKSMIGKANTTSARARRDQVYDYLNIHISSVEKLAFKTRNMAAHGELLAHSEQRKWRTGNTALRTLVNRVILVLLALDVEYFDYSSPPGEHSFPTKPLSSDQGSLQSVD